MYLYQKKYYLSIWKEIISVILILALIKRNFKRAGTETRPYPLKIPDNRQISPDLKGQLSVVAPTFAKMRIAEIIFLFGVDK